MSDSHELAVFLQLYGSDQWVRRLVRICVILAQCVSPNMHSSSPISNL